MCYVVSAISTKVKFIFRSIDSKQKMILNCLKCGGSTIIACVLMQITNFAIVQSAIVTEAAVKGSSNDSRSIFTSCSNDFDCRGTKQYCNTVINLCECRPFYEYNIDASNCNPCPVEGETCMSCCSHSNIRCYHNVCTRCVADYAECDTTQQSSFMNASQIALVAALIMGAAALATLLYRICTKPTYFGSRRLQSSRNAEATESDFQRVARTSLSSIQVRVLSRLRDRPPKYETQHNYDMRIQRQEEESQRANNADVNISIISTLSAAEHAPPSYDGSKESVHELPPPYSDTGHEVLPDIILVDRNQPGQIGCASRSNENPTISIVSSDNPERGGIGENRSPGDNKDEAVHM